jgi:hypothetical protein
MGSHEQTSPELVIQAEFRHSHESGNLEIGRLELDLASSLTLR